MTVEQRSFFDQEAEAAPQAVVSPNNLTLSGPAKVDLSVYRGDTGQFRITVTDDQDNPVDVSAAAWEADIRLKATDPTVITNFDVQLVNGDTSSIDVLLSSDNSELLPTGCVYDVEMRVGSTVTTLIYGTITVTQDVSRP
jgi:hypothetical protein